MANERIGGGKKFEDANCDMTPISPATEMVYKKYTILGKLPAKHIANRIKPPKTIVPRLAQAIESEAS